MQRYTASNFRFLKSLSGGVDASKRPDFFEVTKNVISISSLARNVAQMSLGQPSFSNQVFLQQYSQKRQLKMLLN